MSTERVKFRLLHMTCCCSTQLCWVNPRLPNYCPECGIRCYPAVKSCVTDTDDNATLRLHVTLDGIDIGDYKANNPVAVTVELDPGDRTDAFRND